MQVPESFKERIAQESPVAANEKLRLKKCVILIQSFVYNEMIRLFPMKVPVKNFSGL